MKKIYLSIVAAVSLMFVSCTADWLNTDPSTAVPSDDAIKNIDDAQVALNGIYRKGEKHLEQRSEIVPETVCLQAVGAT